MSGDIFDDDDVLIQMVTPDQCFEIQCCYCGARYLVQSGEPFTCEQCGEQVRVDALI
jgi:transcription initiation factor IIE alpha subunit